MKLNRKWLMVIALVMSLTMVTAGTLAYLTDTDADKNVMTLGKVEIVQNEHQRAKDENGDYKTATIDGKESYVLEAFENDKPLLPTTERKADGTPDNHGAGPYDDTTVSMSQIGSYGTVQVFKSPNAQDKIVTVTNTGRTDAYVRTIIAYEVGAATENLPNRSARYTDDNDDLSAPWFRNVLGNVEIDGNTYLVCEYVYHGAQLSDGTIRHENGILPAGDTTYPSLMQVYLPAQATNEDVEKLDGNNNEKYDIMVLSQAVQADGFDDAATALKAGFGEVNAANVQKWFSEMVIGSPGEKNETNDVPEIKLPNGDDDSVTYDVPAGAVTVTSAEELAEQIANGKTVFLLKAGTYHVPAACKNKTLTLVGEDLENTILEIVPGGQGEAGGQLDYGFDGSTVTFQNLTIKTNNATYAGYARLTGTYKNVNFDQQYCLQRDSVFEYCTFNVSGDQYNIWTWGAPTATFDHCTFNSDGKALLLYGETDNKVVLSNCVFNDTGVLTAMKAAVEVGSHNSCKRELIADNVDVNGYEINDTGYNTGTTLWGNKNSMGTDLLNVVVDGVDVY